MTDVDGGNKIAGNSVASADFLSLTPGTTSTPLARESYVESAKKVIPQIHNPSSRNQHQNEPNLLPWQTNGSPSGIAPSQPDRVYQSVCQTMDVPTVIPSLIPANASPKPLRADVRLYQYCRGEELDRTLAELAEEFVPTYLERDQMLEWLWKLESNRVRTYFGIQAGTLPHDVQMRVLQHPTPVPSPIFQGMNYEAVEITTSELLLFSQDRIRTAYNYVRIVLGVNKDYVIKGPKPVVPAPKRGRAQSTITSACTEVPTRMYSMPASEAEVSSRGKYIPLFASKNAVTSPCPVQSTTPETAIVDADDTGSTMDAPSVPTTPKKKAKRTSHKVPSPSSSIVDLLASDRDSPALAAIVKEWVQKNVRSKKTSPTKPRKPRSKKLPTVAPSEELKQQPDGVEQGNALDCELQALLTATTNAELVSLSTITSRHPSPDPFCDMDFYFQTQPPVDFDFSFSATPPSLVFPPLTSANLFAFDPIGLDLCGGSTGVNDFFGNFGFQPDFSLLASKGQDVMGSRFSFGGIGDGMFSLPSSPSYDVGNDPATMTRNQIEAAQSLDLNDLLSL
ncbi:hypothetical protein BC830DRAFT_602585 [Chytriomyces sp. MP71]|nr:hypothetical protein BC830DRAFT_602585 [Chytriomyces sp. MP71]